MILNLLVESYFSDHWSGSKTTLVGLNYVAFSRLLVIPHLLLFLGLSEMYNQLSVYLEKVGKFGFLSVTIGILLNIVGNIVEFWLYGWLLIPITGKFYTGSPGSNLGYGISGYGTLFLMVGLILLGLIGLFNPRMGRNWRIILICQSLIFLLTLILFIASMENIALIFYSFFYGLSWIVIGGILKNGKSQFSSL